MVANQKMIFVYDDFSEDHPFLMGRLNFNIIKGGESYSFEYEREWLKRTGLSLIMDPELMPYFGRQYPNGKNIFGMFADASPDRWGRTLLNKRERIIAEKEGRKPSKLHDSDYLLGVFSELPRPIEVGASLNRRFFLRSLIFKFPPITRQSLFIQACPLHP